MEIIFDPSLIALKQNISRAEEAIELAGSHLPCARFAAPNMSTRC